MAKKIRFKNISQTEQCVYLGDARHWPENRSLVLPGEIIEVENESDVAHLRALCQPRTARRYDDSMFKVAITEITSPAPFQEVCQ